MGSYTFLFLVVAVNISRSMTARTIIMIVSWRTGGSTLGTIWPLHVSRPRSVVMSLKTPSAVASRTNLLSHLLLLLLLLLVLLLLLLLLITLSHVREIKLPILKSIYAHIQNVLRRLWNLCFSA